MGDGGGVAKKGRELAELQQFKHNMAVPDQRQGGALLQSGFLRCQQQLQPGAVYLGYRRQIQLQFVPLMQ